MSSESDIQMGTERALFLLAEKRSEAVFNELLDYASETCLKNPPRFLQEGDTSQYDTGSTEDILIQKYGARALATLIEAAHGVHDEQKPDDKFHVSELITSPMDFGTPSNNRILENVALFGQKLIDESLAVIGPDTAKWIDKLRHAATFEDELKVIVWLDERLQTICMKSRRESSEDDERTHFYPPFRISPKFIGEYPNIAVQPSCLSASIMTTAFFEKAGIRTLHCGVTTPGREVGNDLLMNTLGITQRRNDHIDYEGIHLRDDTLAPLLVGSVAWSQRPSAQHGAVYARLSSGWWQVDSYGDATYLLSKQETEHLDTIHTDLDDWKHIVPNLEFASRTETNPHQQLLDADNAELIVTLALCEHTHEPELVRHISDALSTIPEESYISYLFENYLMPLLDAQYIKMLNDDDARVRFTSIIEESMQTYFNESFDTPLRLLFESALNEFIRWKDSPEVFIKRCATDEQYRRRRAEDFMQITSVMAILGAKQSAIKSAGYAHLSVDIGNPAMRIGLATLSDFARYDEHPLPPSFWISHWPGSVSVQENIDNPPANDIDKVLLFNTALWHEAHPFTTMRNYDKITSFLSTTKKELDHDDGEGRS